jgi:hemerythrin-like domain-containing protein
MFIYLQKIISGYITFKSINMNSATGNLENDHIHILQLTEIMKRMTSLEVPDIGHIETVVDVIKNFADGIHHAKEENLLFPKLEEKGFSPHQGPVAVMLHEHTEGRNYVKGIVENLSLYRSGNMGAVKDIYKNMLAYSNLLDNHITKENNILFRMADNVLSNEEQSTLLSQFENEEQNSKSGKKPEDYISAINALAAIYLKD